MAPGEVDIRDDLGRLPPSRIAADANISTLLANAASSLRAKNKRLEAQQQLKPEAAPVTVPAVVPASASVETEAESVSDRYGVLEALVKASPGGCAILDGGLATELETRGADINDPLWSAKCLLEESSATLVRQVSGCQVQRKKGLVQHETLSRKERKWWS